MTLSYKITPFIALEGCMQLWKKKNHYGRKTTLVESQKCNFGRAQTLVETQTCNFGRMSTLVESQ